jgi:RNA polymerase sigma-70 factor (ECF subfamily)
VDEMRLPEPILDRADGVDPEHEALLADAVGLALLVVLQTLSPPERLAFVLHDMFSVPFDEIGEIVDRSPDAARQLASRARRRVRGAAPEPDTDPAAQREVVDAFLAAAREGDFDALLEVLAPDIVLRADFGPGVFQEIHGAEKVGRRAIAYHSMGLDIRFGLVNGGPGGISYRDGKPFALMGITIRGGKIAEMDILSDPERLAQLDLTVLDA